MRRLISYMTRRWADFATRRIGKCSPMDTSALEHLQSIDVSRLVSEPEELQSERYAG